MLQSTHSERSKRSEVLYCKSCGNDDRFVQVVSYETHLVNRDFVYLHLLDSDVERYDCYVCGEEVEAILVHDAR